MGRIICLIFLIFVLQNLKNKFMKKYVAEMIGTMVLVLMGCGSAVIAGAEDRDTLYNDMTMLINTAK